jgi:dephospho-CoA kinase
MQPPQALRELRIGLTGGIGSGKSTVARMLVDCGAVLIDTDAISRELTAPGGGAVTLIASQFGPQALTSEGSMNRDVMRQLVFNDPSAKRRLEAIIHPLVSLEVERQAAQATHNNSLCTVYDIPLLVESSRWRQQLDLILVIDCSEAVQISRVIARNGWAPDAVHKVIAAQAGRATRRAAADACICNEDLSIQALNSMVRQLSHRFGL